MPLNCQSSGFVWKVKRWTLKVPFKQFCDSVASLNTWIKNLHLTKTIILFKGSVANHLDSAPITVIQEKPVQSKKFSVLVGRLSQSINKHKKAKMLLNWKRYIGYKLPIWGMLLGLLPLHKAWANLIYYATLSSVWSVMSCLQYNIQK